MHTFHYSKHRRLTGVAAAIALALIAQQSVLAAGDSSNTWMGANALTSNAASSNSAFGNFSMNANVWGSGNSAFGVWSLAANIDGNSNTAIGANALTSNTSGWGNVATGVNALKFNLTGASNTATGADALFNNVGDNNTATGAESLASMQDGWGNTAIGWQSLNSEVHGHNNIGIGFNGGYYLTGSNNIDIGDAGVTNESNTMRLGNGSVNRVFVTGISGIRASGGVQVYINSAGQLGTTTSSERFKKDIKSIDGVSDKLLQLRPVSFIYKEDETNELQYGLIAEEVAKVYPELVQNDKEGKPFTVYYHLLTPLLLSELQKEHNKIDTQQTELASLNQQLGAQRAEMVAMLQQQQQQHVAEMTALQQKLNQLDNLLQANIASRSSAASVAMAPSH